MLSDNLRTGAVDELLISREGRHDLAYFYCSFNNVDSLETHNVLGSILAQICAESDPVYHKVRSRYLDTSNKSFSRGARFDVDTLINLIVEQAKYQGT